MGGPFWSGPGVGGTGSPPPGEPVAAAVRCSPSRPAGVGALPISWSWGMTWRGHFTLPLFLAEGERIPSTEEKRGTWAYGH